MLGRLQLNKVQKGKIAVHVVQALFMFVALCLLIAILTQGGHTDGRVHWYLALCFLSSPALVYLIMTPMWERTVRFANPFVMAGVDIVYAICWFSAFVALAVYKNAGKAQGAKDKKEKGDGGCSTFGYGPARKCELAQAAVGLGVVIFLLWCGTSGISVWFLLRWRKGEGLPWKQARSHTYTRHEEIEAQAKDAWSSDIMEHDELGPEDGRVTPGPAHHGDHESMLPHATNTATGGHPGTSWSPLSNMPDENDYRYQYAVSGPAQSTAYNHHGSGYGP